MKSLIDFYYTQEEGKEHTTSEINEWLQTDERIKDFIVNTIQLDYEEEENITQENIQSGVVDGIKILGIDKINKKVFLENGKTRSFDG